MRYLAFVTFKENGKVYAPKHVYITRYENADKRDSAFDYFKCITGETPQVYFSPEVKNYEESLSFFAMGKSSHLNDIKQAMKEFNTLECFKTNMD